ncbi:MAG: hypothetical protein NXI10_13800 [bacterium]|nr:hypothetical protein [bacterium]
MQNHEEATNKRVFIIIGLVIFLIIGGSIAVSIFNMVLESKEVFVHNPYDQTLKVRIGENSYDLGPYRTKQIKVSKGKQRIKSKLGGKVLLDTTVVISGRFIKNGGIINVGRQPFYCWSEFYGGTIETLHNFGDSATISSYPSSQWAESSADFFTIDSTLLYGVIEEYPANQVVIIKDWSYDLDERFEETVTATDHVQSTVGTSKSKVFSKEGMLEYWEENYEELNRQLEILKSIQLDSVTVDSLVQ